MPPPTINPYNTMSNLKTHSSQHRKEKTIPSLPNSKLSMTSASKLIKSSGSHIYINVERANNSGLNMNERSSTSNSNYYSQTLHLTENPSLTLITEATKTEKRKKTSVRKSKTKELTA